MKINELEQIGKNNETPLLVIDHEKIRKNYLEFKSRLPRVQVYYAVKANSEPEILKTLLKLGASFDVASLSEFNLVFDLVKHLEPKQLQNFIWNNIIYANPIKKIDSLHVLNLYKPLLTYDSLEEMKKVKKHCPDAGLLLRIKVSDDGSMVKFSNKFGIVVEKAVELIEETIKEGLNVEGISFHIGSQCSSPENFIKALESVAKIFEELDKKNLKIGYIKEDNDIKIQKKIVDIGGGFPVKYIGDEQSFEELANVLNKEFNRLFPENEIDILAEPGRFIAANSGTTISSVILAKHSSDPPSYHIDDGVYQTFSALIYDHIPINLQSFKKGAKKDSLVFGPTCDGLDTLSENPYIHNTSKVFLPDLVEGDLIYAENLGAYSNASSTNFNGMPTAKIIHVNIE